jgi:hypothetical protein
MISVDYRMVGRALMKPLQSGIGVVLRVLEWLLCTSPQPGAAPPELAQPAASPPAPSAVASATEDDQTRAVAHLEFLGYEVELQPDGWSYARHPYRYDFHLRAFAHGLNLHCMVGIGASIDNSRAGWLPSRRQGQERDSWFPWATGQRGGRQPERESAGEHGRRDDDRGELHGEDYFDTELP